MSLHSRTASPIMRVQRPTAVFTSKPRRQPEPSPGLRMGARLWRNWAPAAPSTRRHNRVLAPRWRTTSARFGSTPTIAPAPLRATWMLSPSRSVHTSLSPRDNTHRERLKATRCSHTSSSTCNNNAAPLEMLNRSWSLRPATPPPKTMPTEAPPLRSVACMAESGQRRPRFSAALVLP